MNRATLATFVIASLFVIHAGSVTAQIDDSRPSISLVQLQQGEKSKKDDKAAPPKKDRFAEAPDQADEVSTRLSPNMIGDWPGLASFITVSLPTFAKVRGVGKDGQIIDIIVPTTVNRLIRVPIAGRGSVKIADNEGVLPQDRVFVAYNYFSDMRGPSQGSNLPGVITQPFQVPGQGTFPGQVFVPGVNTPGLNVHRQTIGFEKSFLDGAFSLGARVPLFQQNGDPEFGRQDLGDTTFIFKAALLRNPTTGSGLSAGLAVTAPTGPGIDTPQGTIDDVLIQPFLGYQYNPGNLLLFGFTAVVVPTDSRDATILFNDLGIGYRLYQGNGLISSIVPAFEAHVTTPLDNRSPDAPIRGIDMVVLTSGVHFGMGRSVLTLGVATPVTGPRPFNVEAVFQWNLRF